MASKKVKIKIIKRRFFRLIFSSVSTIVFFVLMFFVFWQQGTVPEHDVYISSENPKQGDTLLIKISGRYPAVSGLFENEALNFFRNSEHSDWSSLLGIDADAVPGKYKISVNAFGEKIEKEINIELKNFPSYKLIISKEQQDKGYTGEKIVSNIRNNDNPILNQVLEKFTPSPNFNSSFTFPLVKMQKSGLVFGQFVKSAGYQLQHFGIDLGAATGTKVYAINDGKVVLAKELSNYGKTVVVDHGLGIFSLYLHLDEFKVQLDQDVKKDWVIGLSGNSGLSSGPHLHFSIRDNGTRVDPILFIKASEATDESFNLASITRRLLRLFDIDLAKK